MVVLSNRGKISPFLAMDVMREAHAKTRAGEQICHMEVGQPGTPAPRLVRERAKKAIDQDLIGYTEALGVPALRERIALHYKESYAANIAPEQVVITTGSSAGFILAFLATLDAGDKVAITSPGYPCYREILKALDLEPVFLTIGFENQWCPLQSQIDNAVQNEGVKAILLASPSNPTGVVMEDEIIANLSHYCHANGVWCLIDEIYHGLIYDKSVKTAAGLNEATIVLNSFSKYYSMTGWRIGWMIVPKGLVRALEKLNQHLFISAPALSQTAALAAFDAREELEAIKAGYARNRDILVNGLLEAGIKRCAPADGAFYVYSDMSAFTENSLDFSKHLLETHGIAACPGIDFDGKDGKYMMRFSYAGPEAEIIQAVERLKARPLRAI